MKKGSGSDPFADVQDETTDAEASTEDDSDSEPDRSTVADADASTRAAATKDGDRDDGSESDSSEAVVREPPQNGADDGGVPWVYVRDNVKQDREMVQFYLREYVVEAEDDFVEEVSDELGTDVSKTDVREAAYEAAMHNVDEVVERLQAWGFESVD
ncbi:MSCRAMM family adhesin SdrC (plasmid) [Natrinema zhouii]|uniref:MSCRAMM family adhesin SdrC n=1 Tax=Natrinema zhouii TaxID=1710539 RepID=UPI001CFFEF75|nr:MSCRAMM family adhesin SdrC [Natrinema zhouii]UHQ98510.1 MSCRAMM family adhesin SdrC [Natrinema zhouii]